MAIKFEKLKVGMKLLDIHRNRSVMRELGCWEIRIISIDPVKRTVMASWNGNTARLFTEREITKYYLRPTKAYREQQARRMRQP